MAPVEYQEMVRRFVEAFNRHDLEALGGFCAEGFVYEGPAWMSKLEGKEALKGATEALFRAFPDIYLDYRHQFISGNYGVVEWTLRGTHSSMWQTPRADIPATGKRIELPGVSILEIDEAGLVLRERAYFDLGGVLEQLGAVKLAVPA